MRSHNALNSALWSTACRVLTCCRSSAFLISNLPASLRNTSLTCGSWAAKGSGNVNVLFFKCLFQGILYLAFVIHKAGVAQYLP